MSVKVDCPKCQAQINVAETLTGTKIQCPICKTQIILDFVADATVTKEGTKLSVPPATLPENKKPIQEQAISHLGGWLDIPVEQIQKALKMLESSQAYTIWQIPKGDSKSFRQITAPSDVLKHVQRRILDRLLYRIPISNAAHGFVPGRSIVTNANFHLRTAKAVFNIDLKDAFPSVSSERVYQLYVRYLRVPLLHLGENIRSEVIDEVIEILVKLTTYNGALPQGGPCSGYLLNVACITLDKTIYRLLQHYSQDFRYSRYADDMTISAPSPSKPNIPAISEELRKRIQEVVGECGFQVNPQKCQYAEQTKGKSLEVTGLILEEGKVRIPPKKLEEYRTAIHRISVLPKEQISDEQRLEVQSIIAFVKMVYEQIPPRIWKTYREYLNKIGAVYSKKQPKYLDLYPKADAVPSEPTNS